MKTAPTRRRLASLIVAAATVAPLWLVAAQVPALTSFTTGTVANAADVNANFDKLKATIDANDAASVTRWQEKLLPSNATASGVIPSMTFNNLTVGRTYRVSANFSFRSDDGGGFNLSINNGVTNVTSINCDPAGAANCAGTKSVVFTATATTLTFEGSGFNSTHYAYGTNSRASSFAILEELPNHVVTTAWN